MSNIFEALFILAVDDEEGGVVEPVANKLESILAGAVLAELVLMKRIELTEQRVCITDRLPAGHPVLDQVLFDIIDTSRPRKLKYWINTLIYKKLVDEIGYHLVEQGVLTRKRKRLHLANSSNGHSGGDTLPKYTLKNRLREIVLAGQSMDPSEKVLLAFLYHGEMLKLTFTLGERKAAHKRVKKLVASDGDESVLGKTIEEIVATACD